jgi:hypothetical protein
VRVVAPPPASGIGLFDRRPTCHDPHPRPLSQEERGGRQAPMPESFGATKSSEPPAPYLDKPARGRQGRIIMLEVEDATRRAREPRVGPSCLPGRRSDDFLGGKKEPPEGAGGWKRLRRFGRQTDPIDRSGGSNTDGLKIPTNIQLRNWPRPARWSRRDRPCRLGWRERRGRSGAPTGQPRRGPPSAAGRWP